MPSSDIAEHLAVVRRRIDAAAARAGQPADAVKLIAVSKTFAAERVRAASEAGQRAFGENRVQEGLDKIDALRSLALEWHLIGHLQSNKAKKAAGAFAWIQSIDSLDLLRKVDAAAAELGSRPRVLVQVDLAREETKHGVGESAVRDLVRAALDARAVDLRGLMIVPPFPEDPEDSRPWFRRLRLLRDELVAGGAPADRLAELSMGMSHDFEVAIEEGATMIRVGTAIFGRRTPGAAAP
jgi:pyridoxal phosphate enzyme (YggS family)